MPKHVAQDGLLFIAREMHPSFENMAVTNAFVLVWPRGQNYG
jgi:hypothetical protein